MSKFLKKLIKLYKIENQHPLLAFLIGLNDRSTQAVFNDLYQRKSKSDTINFTNPVLDLIQ